jgi:hypothetical protein
MSVARLSARSGALEHVLDGIGALTPEVGRTRRRERVLGLGREVHAEWHQLFPGPQPVAWKTHDVGGASRLPLLGVRPFFLHVLQTLRRQSTNSGVLRSR